MVEELLRWGASPSAADVWGVTPLHMVMSTAHAASPSIATFLSIATTSAETALPLDAKDVRGVTPLHYAGTVE